MCDIEKLLLVYNPRAGKSGILRVLGQILQSFTAQGYQVTAHPTQAAGDAQRILAACGGDYQRVVVAGGDGTLSEALAGLLSLPAPPPLAYLPFGTTNDCSRNLQLPRSLQRRLAVAGQGVPRPCDAGSFNRHPFLYVAAFGALTQTAYSTPQSVKKLFGYGAYLLGGVRSLASLKSYPLTVTAPGVSLSGDFVFGMVSNTKSVGGFPGFPPGDPALDDGLLEVTLVRPPKNLFELERLGRVVFRGADPACCPLLTCFSVPEIQLESSVPLAWTLDGEFGGNHSRAEVAVLPRCFSVVCG